MYGPSRRRQERSRSHRAGDAGRARARPEHAWQSRLASAFEHGRCLSQVPSPAQAAMVGWLALWCIRDSRVDQLTLCIRVLLRLGVKQIQGVMANSVELISAHRRSDRHWASLALAVSLCVGSSWEKACCSAWLGSRASVARNSQRTC